MLPIVLFAILGVSHPLEYRWVETLSETKRLITKRLYTADDRQTDVHFDYDFDSKDLVQSQWIDERLELLSAPPGQHLWAAHVEFGTTLEEKFKEIQKRWANRNLDQIISEVNGLIYETRLQFVNTMKFSSFLHLQEILNRYDFIEPIRSDVSSDDTRVDAFNLSPLLALKNSTNEVLNALQDLGSASEVYPLEWFVRKKNEYSDETRLVCLMLITHNHLAEDYFIQGVLALKGVDRAWNVLLDLNSAYQAERDFWRLRHERNESLADYYENSGIGFIDARRIWEVDVQPIRRIDWRHNSPIVFDERLERHAIPYKQTYHYYGAFIASWRMQNRLGLQSFLIPKLSQAMGLSYKAATAGWRSSQMQIIRDIYGHGARDALSIHARLNETTKP